MAGTHKPLTQYIYQSALVRPDCINATSLESSASFNKRGYSGPCDMSFNLRMFHILSARYKQVTRYITFRSLIACCAAGIASTPR
jgi:hypothetical protein